MDIFIQRLQSQSRPCLSHHETGVRTRKRLRPNFPKKTKLSAKSCFLLSVLPIAGPVSILRLLLPDNSGRSHFHVEFCTLGQTASIIELGKVHVVQTRGQGNNKTTRKSSNAGPKMVLSWSIYTLVFRRFIDTFPY